MPIKEHCELISKQFLLQTQKNQHPNFTDLTDTTPERPMKDSLHTRFGEEIKAKTGNRRLEDQEYKRLLKDIHTTEVRKVIENQTNHLLQDIPPEINQEEKSLPRKTRCTLAQLRSGYSPFLKTYLHSINASDTDLCPDCNIQPHKTHHLFDCNAIKPTTLTIRFLWTTPRATTTFLGLDIEDTR